MHNMFDAHTMAQLQQTICLCCPPATLPVFLHVLLHVPTGRPHVYPGGSRIDPDTLSYLTEVRKPQNLGLHGAGVSGLEQRTCSQPAGRPARQPDSHAAIGMQPACHTFSQQYTPTCIPLQRRRHLSCAVGRLRRQQVQAQQARCSSKSSYPHTPTRPHSVLTMSTALCFGCHANRMVV
jgi:hypothetical protein